MENFSLMLEAHPNPTAYFELYVPPPTPQDTGASPEFAGNDDSATESAVAPDTSFRRFSISAVFSLISSV